MFLNDEELLQLTGKMRSRAQQKALNQMGIPFKVRADGRTLVLITVVEQLFGATSKKKEREITMDFSKA
ncbi:DUF4224 domain-containing protein [Herbaspirillum sp. NPDC101396]|uniref:DUF4224 domain-containing protein n=1 Tax=Herbaspirillum sp. NPDC101396 TaxID=3364005 RepID=UPI00383A1823